VKYVGWEWPKSASVGVALIPVSSRLSTRNRSV